MPSVLSKPGFWLAVLGTLLLVLCLTLPPLEFFPLDQDAYWLTVRMMENADLRGILANDRTFGYPLFLKLVEAVSPTLEALPFFQMACRVLAVLTFYVGLRWSGMRGWVACAASVPLLVTNTIFVGEAVPRVVTTYTEPVGESL